MFTSSRSRPELSRRHFLGHLTATALEFRRCSSSRRSGPTPARCGRTTSCIVLWMSGGPSHLDIWDLKPESEKNGGPFRPIDTSAPGVKICEHMPKVARQMHHLNIIRSLDSKEGNHDRGTYLMHSGYVPNPTVVHPGWGSIAAYELGEQLKNFDLPHCVAINEPGMGAGFLGMSYSPFVIQNPNAPIANLKPPGEVDSHRFDRRLQMLAQVENDFIAQRKSPMATDHKAVYGKTIRMMNSRLKDTFNLGTEPVETREAYGKGSFGSGCLLARRLVEQGVSYVEVSLGGWDTHTNNFETLSQRLLPELDQGMGAGGRPGPSRTPRQHPDRLDGRVRPHAPDQSERRTRSLAAKLVGRGRWRRHEGGQTVGATDKDGVDIQDRPVGVMDLIATMTKTMGINIDTQYTTPRGRPMKVVDGGKPIRELVG